MQLVSNITLLQIALGDKVDTGLIYSRKQIGIGAFTLIKSDESDFCQKVEIVPGDFIVKARNLLLPKVVKIDVEGYEYPVIIGLQKTLSQKSCQLVCCEIHSILFPSGTKTQMILDLLKSMGFNQIKIHNRGGEIHAICYKK